MLEGSTSIGEARCLASMVEKHLAKGTQRSDCELRILVQQINMLDSLMVYINRSSEELIERGRSRC